MTSDRFGNEYAPGLPYARGNLIRTTEDDLTKLRAAWNTIKGHVANNGVESVLNFSGLERSAQFQPEDLGLLDDELAPALYGDRLNSLCLEHLGGHPDQHSVFISNRLTAGLLVSILTMVEPGDTVIGVSASYSHPANVRAVTRAQATLIDTVGLNGFRNALKKHPTPSLVILTRLAVSYEILSTSELEQIVELAKSAGARILVDDAGGARVGPAVFDQPRTLELDVDIAATGLDKYGTIGPRLGVLAGNQQLIDRIRSNAFEMGIEARPMLYPAVVRSLEQYDPARVRELVATTKNVGNELKKILGNRVTETPVIIQLMGEDVLEIAMERADIKECPVMPIEATAALAMLLLRDYSIITVHLAGIPPGTAALMIKFVPPETLDKFGGAEKLAHAINGSLDELSTVIANPEVMRELVLGAPAVVDVTKS
ncbi:MAG: hypothetical protein VYB37_01755 [Pseudomonadota bacterium]|nr:hypothetical protein [Pseudomonadota bacterium]